MAGAQAEQAWKESAMAIFGQFSGGERLIYRRLCNVDIGPARWPSSPPDASKYAAFLSQLDTIDFFTKVQPPAA